MLEARGFANGIMVTDHLTLNKRDYVGATRNHMNLKHRKARELWQNQSSYRKGDTGKRRMTRSKFLKMMGVSMRQTVRIWERTITIPTNEQQGWGTSVLEQHGPTCVSSVDGWSWSIPRGNREGWVLLRLTVTLTPWADARLNLHTCEVMESWVSSHRMCGCNSHNGAKKWAQRKRNVTVSRQILAHGRCWENTLKTLP